MSRYIGDILTVGGLFIFVVGGQYKHIKLIHGRFFKLPFFTYIKQV